MTRSRRLLDACSATMERALAMRFVQEVGSGAIGDQEYADYLEIEASFVATAARLHGLAVWDAPDWTAMERNARAVHALTTEQADYFRAARAAWPVEARPGAAERARILSDFALAAAREGGYGAVTTVLFAAESLYLAWCTRAHAGGGAPSGPIADWVALHATAAFRWRATTMRTPPISTRRPTWAPRSPNSRSRSRPHAGRENAAWSW